jgi:TetR/AcrR family transcriptional regulator, lmrAB and yxaGH operons repressor
MTGRSTSNGNPAAARDELIAKIGEVFREHGYNGASLTLIGQAVGLGKGSLYHYFPEGKPEMARLVLAHVHGWFEDNIFAPLRRDNGEEALRRMFDGARDYFHRGRRIYLVGAFALDHTRDAFAQAISWYFEEWLTALEGFMCRNGVPAPQSRALSCAAMAAIQGGLTLARAVDDPSVFIVAVADCEARLLTALKENC